MSNAVWGLSRLELPVQGTLRAALLAAVERTVADMVANSVSKLV